MFPALPASRLASLFELLPLEMGDSSPPPENLELLLDEVLSLDDDLSPNGGLAPADVLSVGFLPLFPNRERSLLPLLLSPKTDDLPPPPMGDLPPPIGDLPPPIGDLPAEARPPPPISRLLGLLQYEHMTVNT